MQPQLGLTEDSRNTDSGCKISHSEEELEQNILVYLMVGGKYLKISKKLMSKRFAAIFQYSTFILFWLHFLKEWTE